MIENDLLPFLFIQLVGFVGYSIYVASSFQKNRFKLLAVEALGCGIVAAHWMLLHMNTIALMNLVYVYLSVVSLTVVKYPKARYMLAMSFPMIFFLTISSWQGSVSGLFAITATCLGIIATMLAVCSKFCIDMFKLRTLSLLSSVLWVACGLFAASMPQIVACGAFAYGHFLGLKKLAKDREAQSQAAVTERLTQQSVPVRVTMRENLYRRQRRIQ